MGRGFRREYACDISRGIAGTIATQGSKKGKEEEEKVSGLQFLGSTQTHKHREVRWGADQFALITVIVVVVVAVVIIQKTREWEMRSGSMDGIL